MKNDVAAANGRNTQRTWFSDAIGGAWKLIKLGIASPAAENSALYAELSSLTAPHLAVLAHKRAKYSESADVFKVERWNEDLDNFVARVIWPQLANEAAVGGRKKSVVIETVDAIVASEQCRLAQVGRSLPTTSRFDTSWAI